MKGSFIHLWWMKEPFIVRGLRVTETRVTRHRYAERMRELGVPVRDASLRLTP
jgi:hypothetical protein